MTYQSALRAHRIQLEGTVRYDSQGTKASGGGLDQHLVVNHLQLSMAIHVLDATHEIRARLVLTAGAVADWSVDVANRDLDEDDVYG
ncbi:hypothetical protein PGQ11_011316 [Apiospora arundinis]|uniref:Uncharacterized protein n=1 Tax=Apiospora arundinis TaxID=335852 RepID=A0ABR2HZB6_9PEZI